MLASLPAKSINCCVTSPPYLGLRDYNVDGQLGHETSPELFVAELVSIFREIKRVLRNDGTVWLNIGDSYVTASTQSGGVDPKQPARRHGLRRRSSTSGLRPKNLIGIPWKVAFALQADGWFLRQDIIWSKPNAMPESVKDRCTRSHEYIFLLTKSKKYYYDSDAIMENLETDPKERYEERARVTGRGEQSGASARGGDRDKSGGFPPRKRGVPPRHEGKDNCSQSNLDNVERGGARNKRSVWSVATKPFKGTHFATFPTALIEPCILAGCPAGGTVLDPFFGAGTTGLVSERLHRNSIGIELNPEYAQMAYDRITGEASLLSQIKMEMR